MEALDAAQVDADLGLQRSIDRLVQIMPQQYVFGRDCGVRLQFKRQWPSSRWHANSAAVAELIERSSRPLAAAVSLNAAVLVVSFISDLYSGGPPAGGAQ